MTDHLPITPGKIIEQLEITPITLRRWCGYHKAHLSTGANPGPGMTRMFTGRDLSVLTHVRSLRDQGLNTEQINEQLATLTFAEIETIGDSEETALNAAPTAQEGPDGAQFSLVVLNDLRNEFNAKFEALERTAIEAKQSQREYIQGLAIGFICACLFFILIIGMAILYGGYK